ncbi:MAG: response regulator [Chitinophagaceae bacterium]|nr:response regulator [Chitinophagaceae bacterium]
MQPRILLVDDRPDNLMSIEAILMPDGYVIVKANSGKSALKILLQDYDFALILMDVQMPNMNGFETASLIYEREKLRHIPIVFITAHNYGEENIFKGYQLGGVDYIYKPVDPALLSAKVAVFVELYRKNHRLLIQEQKLTLINRNLESEIRERKSSEEKIKALNKALIENIDRLEAANKDLDNFAFMASHDLQEPLRKIRTFSERLGSSLGDLINEDSKKYIDRIEKSAERMQTLIRDILAFSKISIQQKKFVKTDLNIIMKEILDEYEQELSDKNVTVVLEPLPSLEVIPELIRLLFNNLVNNAIKYRRENTDPLIRIFAKSDDDRTDGVEVKNKYYRIYLEDNGIGFDQVYSEKIFGMFVRLHGASAYKGTGIGLALCKKIVEEHNGHISARSKLNEGAVFTIALPAANVNADRVNREVSA